MPLDAFSSRESCVRSRWAESRSWFVQARWKEGTWEGGKRRSKPSLKSYRSQSWVSRKDCEVE